MNLGREKISKNLSDSDRPDSSPCAAYLCTVNLEVTDVSLPERAKESKMEVKMKVKRAPKM